MGEKEPVLPIVLKGGQRQVLGREFSADLRRMSISKPQMDSAREFLKSYRYILEGLDRDYNIFRALRRSQSLKLNPKEVIKASKLAKSKVVDFYGRMGLGEVGGRIPNLTPSLMEDIERREMEIKKGGGRN